MCVCVCVLSECVSDTFIGARAMMCNGVVRGEVRLNIGRSTSSEIGTTTTTRRRCGNEMVRTEFVYADEGVKREVCLCGDWNNWSSIRMMREHNGVVWSIITIVPVGYREFYYLVDGILKVSTKHPLNSAKSANWRTVKGPPPRYYYNYQCQRRFYVVRLAETAAENLAMFLKRMKNFDGISTVVAGLLLVVVSTFALVWFNFG